MIELKLPYPPTVNHYKKPGPMRKTKSGGVYQMRVNTNETTQYYYDVWVIAKDKLAKGEIKSLDSAMISMDVYVYPPDRRRRDLSNILKVLEDSLQKAGLYDDDNQICRLMVMRLPMIAGGQVTVRLKKIDDCE